MVLLTFPFPLKIIMSSAFRSWYRCPCFPGFVQYSAARFCLHMCCCQKVEDGEIRANQPITRGGAPEPGSSLGDRPESPGGSRALQRRHRFTGLPSHNSGGDRVPLTHRHTTLFTDRPPPNFRCWDLCCNPSITGARSSLGLKWKGRFEKKSLRENIKCC